MVKRPVFWIGIVFALGGILARAGTLWVFALALAMIFAYKTGSLQKKVSLNPGYFFVLLVFLFLGAIKFSKSMEIWSYDALVPLENTVGFTGRVAGFTEKKNSIFIFLDQVAVDGLPGVGGTVEAPNMVCLWAGDGRQWVKNDLVYGRGTLGHFDDAGNPGQFDENTYYGSLGYAYKIFADDIQRQNRVHDPLYYVISELRKYFERTYDRLLKDPGTIKAMVLGEKADLQQEVKELYKSGGISHILAISGLHISILGTLVIRILRKAGLPVLPAVFLASFIVIAYGFMVGFGVSAKRAVFMYLTALGAKACGRTYDFLSAWALSFLLILWGQPGMLWNAGFLMSFASVAGAGFLYPCIQKIFPDNKFIKYLGSGISILLTTLPLTAWYFFEIPIYGLLLNLAVVPLMSLVVCTALAGGIFGGIFSGLGTFLLGSTFYILEFYEYICRSFQQFPGNSIVTGRPGLWQILIYYFLLVSVTIMVYKSRRKEILYALFLLMVIFLRVPQGNLSITFMDVGQGDGIFIHTPGGDRIFIDGGSSSEKQVGKYRIEPFLKYMAVNSLDYVMVTHGDSDHLSGIMEIISGDETDIQTLILPAAGVEDGGISKLIQAAQEQEIEIVFVEAGDKMDLGDMEIAFIHPAEDFVFLNPNEYSLTAMLKYKNFSAILTGDLEGAGEEAVESSGNLEKCDLLKAAHHGSKHSTSENFLKTVSPQITIISCGQKNRYGHPHQETLDRLLQAGSHIYCTAKLGAVTVLTNGEAIEVKTMKQARE